MFRTSSAILAFVAVSLLTATPAVAGKPAPANSSIALAGGATSASVGSWLTFVTSYPSTVKDPAIRAVCTQNGSTVWSQVGTPSASYQLGGASSTWRQVGGNAACVADLVSINWSHGQQTMTILAEQQFAGIG